MISALIKYGQLFVSGWWNVEKRYWWNRHGQSNFQSFWSNRFKSLLEQLCNELSPKKSYKKFIKFIKEWKPGWDKPNPRATTLFHNPCYDRFSNLISKHFHRLRSGLKLLNWNANNNRRPLLYRGIFLSEQLLLSLFQRTNSAIHPFRWSPGCINCGLDRACGNFFANLFLNNNRLPHDNYDPNIVLFLCGQFQGLHSVCRLEQRSNHHLQIGNFGRSCLLFWDWSLLHGCGLLIHSGPVGRTWFKD